MFRLFLYISALLSCIFITQVYAGENYGTLIVSNINSVYDGDTFRCNIEGVHGLIGKNISVRINRVDTPEMRSSTWTEREYAERAKAVTAKLLYSASLIELRNVQRPKYFRILADVYVDGISVADVLIEKNLGRPYFGGSKGSW